MEKTEDFLEKKFTSLEKELKDYLDKKIDPLQKMIEENNIEIKKGNERVEAVTGMLNQMFLYQITSSDKDLQNTLEIMYENLENGNVVEALKKKDILLGKVQGSKHLLEKSFSNVSKEIFPKENLDVVIKQQDIYSTLESLIKEVGEDVVLVGKQTDVIIEQNNSVIKQNNILSRQNNKIGAKANDIIEQLDTITKLVGGVVKTQETQGKSVKVLEKNSEIAKQHRTNDLVRSGHRQ